MKGSPVILSVQKQLRHSCVNSCVVLLYISQSVINALLAFSKRDQRFASILRNTGPGYGHFATLEMNKGAGAHLMVLSSNFVPPFLVKKLWEC